MAVKVTIGMMNKRITLAAPIVTKNSSGGRVTSYTDEITAWANVRQKSSFKGVEANVSGVDSTHEFYIRQSSDTIGVDKNWLIKYNGKAYSVNTIEKLVEANIMYKITASEREDSLNDES
ncbi:MAG: phage head closure protein [Agriterribacter sp.]